MSQQLSGGNPGSYLQVANTINAGLLEAVHILNSAAYNPSTSGGISTVSFSFDTKNFSGSQAMQPVILQNGIYWFGASQASPNNWATLSFSSLNSSSFGVGPLQSTGLTLDFSPAGAAMTFGFSGANSDYYSTSIVGVDNFSVSVSAIPEPSTYAAALGLGALAMTWYWRRRQS